MAPIKLEDNIKEQFKNHTIEPSSKSWDALASKLDKEQIAKESSTLWWKIAASIVGLVLVGSLLFMNSNKTVEDSLVTVPKTTNQQELNTPLLEEISPAQIENNTVVSQESKTEDAVPSIELQPNIEKAIPQDAIAKEEVVAVQTPNSVLALQSTITEDSIAQSRIALNQEVPVNTITADPIDTKVLEVVATITAMEQNNQTLTESEINALLLAAQKDLKVNQIVDPVTNTVDANDLLLDVEFELERSFRDKVFDALGDGYKKIRTAVAERNN